MSWASSRCRAAKVCRRRSTCWAPPPRLSINGYSAPEVQDAVAEVIDRMMTQEFLVGMAMGGWPGYWGVPISADGYQPG